MRNLAQANTMSLDNVLCDCSCTLAMLCMVLTSLRGVLLKGFFLDRGRALRENRGASCEYYEARNDYTNSSETILLCNTCVRAIGNINSQTINVCNWRIHRKYLMKVPESHKEFLPEGQV